MGCVGFLVLLVGLAAKTVVNVLDKQVNRMINRLKNNRNGTETSNGGETSRATARETAFEEDRAGVLYNEINEERRDSHTRQC